MPRSVRSLFIADITHVFVNAAVGRGRHGLQFIIAFARASSWK